ncbi:MAG: hypothetical protein EVA65_13455 [Oceanococcus sp.]|nr:MAG: hypothetical protein EVA65_13455 [Oceanococcus sp.]
MELIILISIIVVVLKKHRERQDKKLYESSFPTRAQYIAEHGQKNGDVRCCGCGSSRIRNWSAGGRLSPYRLHVCHDCDTILYRTERKLPKRKHRSFRLS